MDKLDKVASTSRDDGLADPAPEALANAVEAFHAALENEPSGRGLGHGRDGDWIDDSVTAVVDALLRAGWTPPTLLP